MKSGVGGHAGGVGDVIGQGDDAAPPRSRVGLLVGVAAALALAALAVLPQVDRDDAAPAPTTSPTPPPAPPPSERRPVIGDLRGPLRSAPVGLAVFGRRGDTLLRLDVDSGRTTLITGLGELTRHRVHTVPWGTGAAVVKTPEGVGGEYDMPVGTVFRLAAGAQRAVRVGTAHNLVPGARAGDLLLVTYATDGGPHAVTTYDARGLRRATRRVPNAANVAGEVQAGLITIVGDNDGAEVRVGRRVHSFPARSVHTVADGVAVTQQTGCGPPCPTWLTDLHDGTERRIHLAADEQLVEISATAGASPLVRVAVVDADQTVVGERVYQLDAAGGGLQAITGAYDVGPLHRATWNHDGSVAFIQSNSEWACYTQAGGLELLQRRGELDVVGVT